MTHVNSFVPAIYMSYMHQNLRLFRSSALTVLSCRFAHIAGAADCPGCRYHRTLPITRRYIGSPVTNGDRWPAERRYTGELSPGSRGTVTGFPVNCHRVPGELSPGSRGTVTGFPGNCHRVPGELSPGSRGTVTGFPGNCHRSPSDELVGRG